MNRLGTYTVVLLAAASFGCTTAGGSASPPGTTPAAESSAPSWADWDEPDDYRFTVESSCGERNFLGVYRVTVRGGAVIAADHDARFPGDTVVLPPEELQQVPTLGEMLDEALSATGDPGAGEIEVVTDPADGHPRTVSVDRLEGATDDESCYVITDYQPGA